jgi:hypothetical protein
LLILRVCLWAFTLAAAQALPAFAMVTDISITAIEPFAEGASFGNSGAYERVRGTYKGTLDPFDARNKVIVNIDGAPRNAAGRVEYEAEFFILRPVDAARGSGKILYDVVNRGRKGMHTRFMDALPATLAESNDPKALADVGNGLLLRRGYTLVWSSLDPDAPRSNNGMSMTTIFATNNGAPIERVIRDEIVADTRVRAPAGKDAPKWKTLRLSHEAASLDQSKARLTARRAEAEPRVEIPASGWKYVNAREIALLPEGTNPQPGTLYEIHYPAKNPKVLGAGFAAVRDLVSFLRNNQSADNPARPGIKATLAYGSSWSGRFLRDFIHLGFNQDESARKVFDGVFSHIAGGGGVFLNYEFGQPVRTSTQHEDRAFPETQFPFSTARMSDPHSGKTDSLFRDDGFDPLLIETNTSTEYWQKGASLLATDPLGQHDVELPANSRVYLVAGTQHGGTAGMRAAVGPCANLRNPHSPNPGLRALLVALDEWVSEGKAPPASRTPRLADGTLVPPGQLRFPAIPGMQKFTGMNDIRLLRDWIKPDVDFTRVYGARVPQIDADGNETSGIRLPDIAVPLATHTGWNLYKSPFPEGELCDRDGSYFPFAATRAEREANNDPRPSLEERYGSHAGYVRKVEEAAQKLVAERLLLQEDAERLAERAKSAEIARWFKPASSIAAAAMELQEGERTQHDL